MSWSKTCLTDYKRQRSLIIRSSLSVVRMSVKSPPKRGDVVENKATFGRESNAVWCLARLMQCGGMIPVVMT